MVSCTKRMKELKGSIHDSGLGCNIIYYGNIEKLKRKKSRLQTLAKQNTLGETSRNVTSHPKDHQPRLSQLPLLFQEHREVVHGEAYPGDSPRVAPRAPQGLGGADGAGGVEPQFWIRLRVPCGEGKKVMALCLD